MSDFIEESGNKPVDDEIKDLRLELGLMTISRDGLKDRLESCEIALNSAQHINQSQNDSRDAGSGCESALKELVELKDYKDEFGKTVYYIQRQPVVWNNARRALQESDQ